LKQTKRYVLTALMLAIGAAVIFYTQFRFDRSDLDHAVNAVRTARPGGHQDLTLEEKIHQNFGVPIETIGWVPEIASKLEGKVNVRVLLPKNTPDMVFQVDLVRMAVAPMTPAAAALSEKK